MVSPFPENRSSSAAPAVGPHYQLLLEAVVRRVTNIVVRPRSRAASASVKYISMVRVTSTQASSTTVCHPYVYVDETSLSAQLLGNMFVVILA